MKRKDKYPPPTTYTHTNAGIEQIVNKSKYKGMEGESICLDMGGISAIM